MLQTFFRFFLLGILQFGFYFHSNIATAALSYKIKITNPDKILSDKPILSPKDIIFQVKHCKSPNVVIYQANRTIKNLLDPEKPIDVYWLMNTKGKKIEALTSLEWKMAFGYKLITVLKGKLYKIRLNAIKSKEIIISQNDAGKVDAYMSINGVYSKLTSVFINFEYSLCLPDVKYVEFCGDAISSDKKMIERVLPQK